MSNRIQETRAALESAKTALLGLVMKGGVSPQTLELARHEVRTAETLHTAEVERVRLEEAAALDRVHAQAGAVAPPELSAGAVSSFAAVVSGLSSVLSDAAPESEPAAPAFFAVPAGSTNPPAPKASRRTGARASRQPKAAASAAPKSERAPFDHAALNEFLDQPVKYDADDIGNAPTDPAPMASAPVAPSDRPTRPDTVPPPAAEPTEADARYQIARLLKSTADQATAQAAALWEMGDALLTIRDARLFKLDGSKSFGACIKKHGLETSLAIRPDAVKNTSPVGQALLVEFASRFTRAEFVAIASPDKVAALFEVKSPEAFARIKARLVANPIAVTLGDIRQEVKNERASREAAARAKVASQTPAHVES